MRKYYIHGIVFASLLTSCGSGDAAKAQRDSAENLQAEITNAMQAEKYAEAVAMIDSFSTTFHLQVDIRRALIPTRAKAVEGITLQNIPALDKQIADFQANIAALEGEFTSVKTASSLPPYLVYKGCTGTVDGVARIQARVNTGDDAEFSPWVLAVGTGRNIGVNRLQVSTKQGAAYTIDVPQSDYAQASVPMENISPLAKQLYENDDEIASVTAYGTNGNATIKVTPAESRGIASAWKLCADRDSLRSTLIAREKAERLLQMARDKAVN